MKNRRMSIDEHKIDKIKYNSKESHLFLSLCYKNSINFNPRFTGNLPEQDHIFSKKELSDANISDDIINSIYNIRFVSQADNRSKSDTPYAEWIKDLGANKKNVLQTHLITEDKEWLVSSYEEFLTKRRELMLQQFDN